MKYSDFFELIKTTSERDAIVLELQKWQNNLYESADRANNVMLDSKIVQWIATQPDKIKAIKELTSLLNEISVIEITTACDLPEKSLEKIHNKALELVKTPCNLKIIIDPVIVGGAQITFQGKYFDGSLAKKSDEYFHLHRQQIITELKPQQPGNEKLQ